MCLTPIVIPNVNYGHHVLQKYGKDTTSKSIAVPCGVCSQCRSRKQSDILQRVQLQSLSSYVYFFTLTYNKHVPIVDMANGNRLMYANYKHVMDMFKRIRNHHYFGDRNFKYLVTDERGKKSLRPHYHGLLFIEKKPGDSRLQPFILESLAFDTILHEWRVNVATTIAKKDSKRYKKGQIIPNHRCPKYEPLCDYIVKYRGGRVRSTFDLHYVKPKVSDGDSDVSYYVTKYLFKDQDGIKFILRNCYESTETKQEAIDLYNKVFKCRKRQSLNLSNIYTDSSYKEYRSCHLPICLEYSKPVFEYLSFLGKRALRSGDSVKFYDLYTGKPLPISKYLLDKMPDDIQLHHSLATRKYLDNLPYEVVRVKSKGVATKYHNSLRKQDRYVISDLFDDDSLLNL